MKRRWSDAALRRAYAVRVAENCASARVDAAVRASLQAYRVHEARLPIRGWEFVWQQAGYVRKRWWLLQGAVLVLLWLILRSEVRADSARRCIGVLAPAFGMLMIPELWKNRSCGAVEVECAARFALRQVYAARMLLFGMVDLAWISLFLASASLGLRLELRELLFEFCVPLNVTCCICFRTLCARRVGSQGMAALLCGLWIAAWVLVVLERGLYAFVSVPAWCALLALSGLYLLGCVARLCRNFGENGEAMPSWN